MDWCFLGVHFGKHSGLGVGSWADRLAVRTLSDSLMSISLTKACVDCGSSTQDPGHPDDPLFSELDGLGLEPMEEGGGEQGSCGGGSGEGEGCDEARAQRGAKASSSQDLAMEEEKEGRSSASPALPTAGNGTS